MQKPIIVLLVTYLLLSIGCSNDVERSERRSADEAIVNPEIVRIMESEIRYRVDVLTMKYGITSDQITEVLMDFFSDQDLVLALDRDKEALDEDWIERLIYKKLDRTKITQISESYNIPTKVLGGIIYDYELWRLAGERRE
jgi:hypothetical protein